MKLALKLFILILALALAVLGTYVIAKIREARIEARYPPIGQTVQVNGKNIQAYVTGSWPDLVMIHGSSGNMRDLILALEDTLALLRLIQRRLGLNNRPPRASPQRSEVLWVDGPTGPSTMILFPEPW